MECMSSSIPGKDIEVIVLLKKLGSCCTIPSWYTGLERSRSFVT